MQKGFSLLYDLLHVLHESRQDMVPLTVSQQTAAMGLVVQGTADTQIIPSPAQVQFKADWAQCRSAHLGVCRAALCARSLLAV